MKYLFVYVWGCLNYNIMYTIYKFIMKIVVDWTKTAYITATISTTIGKCLWIISYNFFVSHKIVVISYKLEQDCDLKLCRTWW